MNLNIERKHLCALTRDEFANEMLIFKRWLKENGYYKSIINYILPKGVTEDYIYKETKNCSSLLGIEAGFESVLRVYPFIKTNYEKLGNKYWCDNIRPISNLWHKWRTSCLSFNIF